jgi:hypothetical protein
VGKAKLGQDGSGSGEAKVLDQVLSENPHRNDVEQDSPLPSKTNDSGFGVEFEQFFMI